MEANSSDKSGAPSSAGRPFLGVHMKCCNTYTRAYLVAVRKRFEGRCPKCGAFININVVEEGGSSSRFFEAS